MLGNLLIENILSQQRWNGKYLLLLVRVHRAERQSQAFRYPQRSHPAEQIQQKQFSLVDGRGQLEIVMQEQVLMSDAHQRRSRTEEEIRKPRQQLIKVDDDIRLTFLDTLSDKTHAFGIFRQLQQVIQQTVGNVGTFVRACRQKIRTGELFDGSLYVAGKEPRQPFRQTLSHQYLRYVIPVSGQQPFHGNSLSQMAPALSLHNKQNFHDDLVLMSVLIKFVSQIEEIQ
ncbi:uncharacterized protein BN659_02050 [Bacteroides sp. CAG:443]|nr:uncharacterized protein BN659_02050 [Bacteroides sp. CAG:443]